MMSRLNNILAKILVVLFTILLVGCTCLPFSSPFSKTPITGNISYSDIYTYIGVNVKDNPQWDGWSGTADQDQTLSYSISPDSHYVTINEDTGEITVLANALFSNNFTVTATGYGEFQDSVSTDLSVEVRPPFLYNVYNVNNDISLEYGAEILATALMGETTYLFVRGNGSINVSSVQSNGSLYNVANFDNSGYFGYGDRYSVATAEVGGTTYLFMSGYGGGGVSMFSVGDDGNLNNVTNVKDDATLKLQGTTTMTTSLVGGTTYLFVGGHLDHGVSVFSVGGSGFLSNVDNSDDADLKLSNVNSITTAVVGGNTYLFVAGWFFDSDVIVLSVGNDGTLSNVDSISGSTNGLKFKGSITVATAEVGNSTYLFVGRDLDDGVSVFSVGNDGTLNNVDNVKDDDTLEIRGVETIATAEVEGTTYLFVAGYIDQGLSTFSVGDDGRLVNVDNLSYDSALVRYGYTIIVSEIGGKSYLILAGLNESIKSEINVFSINPDSLRR